MHHDLMRERDRRERERESGRWANSKGKGCERLELENRAAGRERERGREILSPIGRAIYWASKRDISCVSGVCEREADSASPTLLQQGALRMCNRSVLLEAAC